jgi:hypothetical protein
MVVKGVTVCAAGIAVALTLASCHLDNTGKDHCVTAAECRPGNACVAETCVAFDPDGAAWSPTLIYMAGLRRSACDSIIGTYTAGEAMRRAGFTDAPYLNTGGSAFYATGVNQDTRMVVALTPSQVSNDFWFEVMANTQAAGATALRWRDDVMAELKGLTLPCDASGGVVNPDPNIVANGPPSMYYVLGSFTTPTKCGGIALCTKTARAALAARGAEPGPTDPNATLIAGVIGSTSVAIGCSDFGTYAVFTIFTSSARDSGVALAADISNSLWGATCL